MALAAASALLAYRPLEAWWIWLLWAAGLVFPDEEQGPKPAAARGVQR